MTSAPSGTFATADRPINIAANRDEQWQALANHLGRSDLLTHPDYRTREDRKRNRNALRRELETLLRQRPAADWLKELNGLGVPAGPVLDVPSALADEQVDARGLIGTLDTGAGPLRLAGSPVMLDGMRPAPQSPPPELGADNRAVWGALGLSGTEIDALKNEGVI